MSAKLINVMMPLFLSLILHKIPDLQYLRVGRKVETVLEVYDCNGKPLQRGGELVTAEIHHRDAGVSKSMTVSVLDRRDGTYLITFVPDVPGKLALCVYIKEQQIKVFISEALLDV